MSKDGVNTRRRVLVGASLVVGGVGSVAALTPFVSSWNTGNHYFQKGLPSQLPTMRKWVLLKK